LKTALQQLNENVSKARKDKLALQNENHRMRIKYAESKVGQMLRNSSKSTPNLHQIDNRERKVTICKTETDTTKPLKEAAAEEDVKTTLEFSSADSLESSVSLVSAGISQSLVSQKTDRTPSSASSSEVTEVIVNPERGTREKRFKDGRVEIWYSNGNRKEISGDQSVVSVFYYNGDLKESHKSGLVRYLYSDTTTWHTRHPDGREVTQFSNGQTEERHVDGSVSIIFPDGTRKVISASGVETITFPDNTVVTVQTDGQRTVRMPREVGRLQPRHRVLIK